MVLLKVSKGEIICFALFVFLATVGYWLRSDLFGFDSYAGWNAIKFGFFSTFVSNPVWVFLLQFLPNSIVFFKLFMFSSAFFGLLAIWFLVAKFYDKRLAWISCFLLVALSPVFLFSFGEFENELVAYPLLLWAIYFFFDKEFDKALVFGWFGFLFWPFIYYLTFLQRWSSSVLEMNLFHGVLDLWLLLPFVPAIFFIKDKRVKLFGLFGVGVWLWNAKLFVFLFPFIALSIANAMNMLQNNLSFKKIAYLLAFFCLIGWNITYFVSSPNQNDWFLVKTAVNLSNDQNIPIYSDIGWEYWVENITGKQPLQYQVSWANKNIQKPYLWLTGQDSNCELIEQRVELVKKKNLFKCV